MLFVYFFRSLLLEYMILMSISTIIYDAIFIEYGSANTADHPLLARRFVTSGSLDRLGWRGLCFRMFLTCRDSLVLAGSWFWHVKDY